MPDHKLTEADIEREREAFERWLPSIIDINADTFLRLSDGRYLSTFTQLRWEGYLTRASSEKQELERLKVALEPFAKAADIKLCGEWRDDERFGQTDVSFHLTFGDLRKARAALTTGKDG